MKKITVREFRDLCTNNAPANAAQVVDSVIEYVGIFAYQWPDGMDVTEDNAFILARLCSEYWWGLDLDWLVEQLSPASLGQFVQVRHEVGIKRNQDVAKVKEPPPITWEQARQKDPGICALYRKHERQISLLYDEYYRTSARAFVAAIEGGGS